MNYLSFLPVDIWTVLLFVLGLLVVYGYWPYGVFRRLSNTQINTMSSFGDDTIQTAALGRPFQLGMLYDCRKDALIPGITLWDKKRLQKNTSVQQQNNTEFKVTASDSIEEKSNSLKISDSLKLSLLGGLVNVGGSAKYFQDTKKSDKQARLTLKYETTTTLKTLTMSHLGPRQVSHPNAFEDNTATHVVTAILYGAAAYFVFDRESSSEDDKKQVEVEAFFSKMKNLKTHIEADDFLYMYGQENTALEKISCTFHGDFKLPTDPTSFSDAVKIYRELPKLLGENGEHAVPLRVWLYPLCMLDSRAAKLHRHISNDLIKYSLNIIESLAKTEIRCNDLLKDRAAVMFPAMDKKIQDLRHSCHHYKLDFVQKLGSVLPSIRDGREEESALAGILKAHDESPFNSKDLDQWLTNKENESETLKSFLKQLEKIGAKMGENFETLSPDVVKTVVSFSFIRIDQPDSFLNKILHLRPAKMVDSFSVSSDIEGRDTECLSADTIIRIKKQLKLFEELKQISCSTDTEFIVTSKYDGSLSGACIYLYENGCDDRAIRFVPPSKPATPTITKVLHSSITVLVSDPDSATVKYRVEYREKCNQETEWKSELVQKNQEAVTLSGLKPETEYEIRATAVGKLNYALSSDVINTITTTAISPPTNVAAVQVKATSITLTWIDPSFQKYDFVKQYIVEFKENNEQWQREDTKEEIYTLKNLKKNTNYYIRMCTDAGVEVSKPSEVLEVKTKRVLDPILYNEQKGEPVIYVLNLNSAGACQLNKKVFGQEAPDKPNKTIMFVGATGSGKTTLINGMINYILGVEWEDDWRFKLIDEQTQLSQTCSQTSEVTAYQIHYREEFEIPYSLTIIDTPGFGDTRGIKQDKEITEKIRQFFSVQGGIDSIHAVCFVVQSALARLTFTQKYIFEAILSIFGKNIANNIGILVTFADGKLPPVLEAIEAAQIPCGKRDGSTLYFKFNNSVLFSPHCSTSDEDNFDKMFWKMGKASMKTFFDYLGTMESQSLTLTKAVLTERRQLEVTVEGIQPMIKLGLSKLDEIKEMTAKLTQNEDLMKANKDFEYEVEVDEPTMIEIEKGKFITNCSVCQHTCHFPCSIADDKEKQSCAAIRGSNCTVCPGKCIWNMHFNMAYKWELTHIKKKGTYQELKQKYEKAYGEKMNSEKILKTFQEEYDILQGHVLNIIDELVGCLKRLKEIALRPDPLATPDYIDLMIKSEEQEGKPGFKKRVAELQEVRKEAELLQKLAAGKELSYDEKEKFDKMEKLAETTALKETNTGKKSKGWLSWMFHRGK